jgi:hypothetical protein
MSIITKVDFLGHFPMFGGMDEATLLSAIGQAESEYSTDLPNWLPITLNLIAHILTARTMGVAQSVDLMGTANGSSKFSMTVHQYTYNWKGTSLQSTPYGQEVARLLTGTVGGCLFI